MNEATEVPMIFNVMWHKLRESPANEGFYLALLHVTDTDKYYFDVLAYKDGRWKMRTSVGNLHPVDIAELDKDWTGFRVHFEGWAYLPDIQRAIDTCKTK